MGETCIEVFAGEHFVLLNGVEMGEFVLSGILVATKAVEVNLPKRIFGAMLR